MVLLVAIVLAQTVGNPSPPTFDLQRAGTLLGVSPEPVDQVTIGNCRAMGGGDFCYNDWRNSCQMRHRDVESRLGSVTPAEYPELMKAAIEVDLACSDFPPSLMSLYLRAPIGHRTHPTPTLPNKGFASKVFSSLSRSASKGATDIGACQEQGVLPLRCFGDAPPPTRSAVGIPNAAAPFESWDAYAAFIKATFVTSARKRQDFLSQYFPNVVATARRELRTLDDSARVTAAHCAVPDGGPSLDPDQFLREHGCSKANMPIETASRLSKQYQEAWAAKEERDREAAAMAQEREAAEDAARSSARQRLSAQKRASSECRSANALIVYCRASSDLEGVHEQLRQMVRLDKESGTTNVARKRSLTEARLMAEDTLTQARATYTSVSGRSPPTSGGCKEIESGLAGTARTACLVQDDLGARPESPSGSQAELAGRSSPAKWKGPVPSACKAVKGHWATQMIHAQPYQGGPIPLDLTEGSPGHLWMVRWGLPLDSPGEGLRVDRLTADGGTCVLEFVQRQHESGTGSAADQEWTEEWRFSFRITGTRLEGKRVDCYLDDNGHPTNCQTPVGWEGHRN
jgi:hypothetical protein